MYMDTASSINHTHTIIHTILHHPQQSKQHSYTTRTSSTIHIHTIHNNPYTIHTTSSLHPQQSIRYPHMTCILSTHHHHTTTTIHTPSKYHSSIIHTPSSNIHTPLTHPPHTSHNNPYNVLTHPPQITIYPKSSTDNPHILHKHPTQHTHTTHKYPHIFLNHPHNTRTSNTASGYLRRFAPHRASREKPKQA